jgi:hypothetical protein
VRRELAVADLVRDAVAVEAVDLARGAQTASTRITWSYCAIRLSNCHPRVPPSTISTASGKAYFWRR